MKKMLIAVILVLAACKGKWPAEEKENLVNACAERDSRDYCECFFGKREAEYPDLNTFYEARREDPQFAQKEWAAMVACQK